MVPTRFQQAYKAPRTPSPPREVQPRHYSKQVSRDDRIRIQTLREYMGWTYHHIADTMGFTTRQVQTACTSPVTPKKGTRKGNRAIGPQEKHQLEAWFLSDQDHRHIAWQDLPFLVPPPLCKYGSYALSSALRDLGYERRTRPRRIHLTDAHERARIQSARDHPRDLGGEMST